MAQQPNCPQNNPNCEYPGESPDLDKRYSVRCTMTENQSGAVNYDFGHGLLDYIQAGQLIGGLNATMAEWYAENAPAATWGRGSGIGVDEFTQEIIRIEEILKDK